MIKEKKTAKYIIHVGIHKTATTFLQRRFLPRLEGVRYCPMRETHEDFLNYVLSVDDLEFSVSRARRLFEKNFQLSKRGGPILLSDEQFYGSPWDGGASRKTICDRLASVFPGAHIVVVLRNQPDLLQSLYLQYIKTGGSAHWSTFLKSRRHPLIISDAYFKYGNYIAYLMETFGNERVTVLLYEDLKYDPAGYLNRWCNILGIGQNSWDEAILQYRENSSLSPTFVPVMRFMNKFASSTRQPYLLLPRWFHSQYSQYRRFKINCSGILPSKPDSEPIPTHAVEEFLKDCHESNRLLEQLINRDLGGLGYSGVGQSFLTRK